MSRYSGWDLATIHCEQIYVLVCMNTLVILFYLLELLLTIPCHAASPNLSDKLKVLEKSKTPLNLVNTSERDDTPVVLIVQPLDFVLKDFKLPIQIAHGLTTFVFKWSKRRSIEANVFELKKAVLELSLTHSNREVIAFASSAGGVLLVKTIDELSSKHEVPANFYFHSVSSPVNGYGAPRVAAVANPLVGKTTISIGIGLSGRLQNKRLQNCEQWVTTNCELDKHACKRRGGYPQLLDDPPCGTENVHMLNFESHSTVFPYVMREVLARKANESK